MRLLRALRPFRRDPGFATLAVLTLAIGLGATTAIFSVVNGVLLEQLPYRDPERLLFVDHQALPLELPSMGISRKLYLHYAENARALDGIAIYDQYQATLTEDGPPERVGASNVTPSYFEVLGVTPMLGRLFQSPDGLADAPRSLVLGESLWRSRYRADPDIVGRAIRLDGEPHEVIGVLRAEADAPNAAQNDTVIYRNRRIDPTTLQLGNFSDVAIARMAEAQGIDEVRADFSRLLANLGETFGDERSAGILERAGFEARVDTLLDRMVGPIRPTLWILLATVAAILIIACTNVANLFLVRVEERSHELAIRSALGASRRSLISGLLAESLAISLMAGGIGLAGALAATDLIRRYGPESLPRLEEISVNARVAVFALLVSIVAGVLFGILPALRGTTQRLVSGLKDGSRASTAGRERHLLRNFLVTAQVALSLLLLVSSGLLVRTLVELRQVDPGFNPENALSFRVTLPEIEYPEAVQRVDFIERALERIAALPGVETATVASGLPLARNASGSGYAIEEQPTGPDQLPNVFMQSWVSPGHLRAMGIDLIEGRDLEPADHHQRTGNILVNRAIAQRFWPDGGALGKRIASGDPEGGWYTIVGVAGDVHDFGLDQDAPLRVYRPLLGHEADEEDIGGGLSFVVRTNGPETEILPAARSVIWEIDPNLPISSVRSLSELVDSSRAQMSFTVVILAMSAALALLLAAVGLYGVISYVVARRTAEIGVRMALGANKSDVLRMVLGSGLMVTAAGTIVGLVLSFGLTRLLDSILFGVGTLDPATFLTVPLLLFAVALLASYIPARRAARVAPATALRSDG